VCGNGIILCYGMNAVGMPIESSDAHERKCVHMKIFVACGSELVHFGNVPDREQDKTIRESHTYM